MKAFFNEADIQGATYCSRAGIFNTICITGLPDQSIGALANVEANVGSLAQPGPVSPNPVDFGKVRIHSAPVGAVDLSISNLAVVGARSLQVRVNVIENSTVPTRGLRRPR